MMNLVGKLRFYAQSANITFESWILAFTGIVLIRIFFEQFSSFMPGRFPVIDLPTIMHYGAFFLASLVMLMVILMFFAKTSLKEVSAICIFGFFVIWLVPIIDLATGGVGGHTISYLFVSGKELLLQFVTYFSGGHVHNTATLGIKIEGILGMIFCYTYVYAVTKNIARSVGAAFSFYAFLFLLGSTPSIIALFIPHLNGTASAIVQTLASSNIVQNNIHPAFSATNVALIDLGFNKMMLGISTIAAIIATMLLFFVGARNKFIAMIKNSRPERIFYFFLLFTFGIALAHTKWFTSWIDIQTYALAIIALICAAMVSICQNDINDETIDLVSNPNRPLVAKNLSRGDMEVASKIFLIFALLSAYASSHYVLFFTCLMMFIYFIYSNPPLRLKRFVIVNSGLVSLACVSAVLEGFFLVSGNKSIVAFPFGLAVAIVIFHTAVTNIRDIKDYAGDKAAGIKTLPVLLGLKKSKQIIAGAICLFYLLIPWYFHIPFLIIPSIIATILSWYFITEENYKEWRGFATYMIYLILIIATIAFQ